MANIEKLNRQLLREAITQTWHEMQSLDPTSESDRQRRSELMEKYRMLNELNLNYRKSGIEIGKVLAAFGIPLLEFGMWAGANRLGSPFGEKISRIYSSVTSKLFKI